jgi:hypothetical protein
MFVFNQEKKTEMYTVIKTLECAGFRLVDAVLKSISLHSKRSNIKEQEILIIIFSF